MYRGNIENSEKFVKKEDKVVPLPLSCKPKRRPPIFKANIYPNLLPPEGYGKNC